MPYANSSGVKIWWEEQGRGEPVLAIMGLSFPLQMWYRTAPALARKFRVILMDNRGVGLSDVPRGPYLISRMAADAAAVLDAAGVRSAHVVGASMGGMIAQELALRYPNRVRSLLLGCTWCGGVHAVRPNLRLFPMRTYHQLSAEGKVRALIPMIYTPDTPAERIEEDIQMRLVRLPTPKGYHNQLMGTLVWHSWSRLPQLKIPVKIVHGEQDRLIPVANAHILASRIPDVRTFIIPGAGHVFTTDQPEIANREALNFLEEVSEEQDAMSRLA